MMLPILSTGRWIAALVVVLAWLALCAAVIRRERQRRRAAERAAAKLLSSDGRAPSFLVAHASQTGTAEALAWQTAQALQQAGLPARIASLATVGAADLRASDRALFIVSTYGEGDPPDSAAPFARRVMPEAGLALGSLHYAVLALGDRTYANFCGFGRMLDDWLGERGARPLFTRIDVDNGSPAAIASWRERLSGITADLPEQVIGPAPAFGRWRLASRRLLNPGSAGAPAWHIELVPDEAPDALHWRAGDLFQVVVPADRDHPREYSIASLPSDGSVQLLVRLSRRTDGGIGLASGWLAGGLAIGEVFPGRIRSHPGFQLGANAARPLILIGNGTGIAGLRSLIKARAADAGVDPHATWLLFGERSAAHDAFYDDELTDWLRTGVLTRCDRVYSRDQAARRYVQHRLAGQIDGIRHWVAAGAAIYVCGSLQGMATGVDEVLVAGLGREVLDDLIVAGRYRRDVY